MLQRYSAGFNECAQEVNKYLATVHPPGQGTDLRLRLMTHLADYLTHSPDPPAHAPAQPAHHPYGLPSMTSSLRGQHLMTSSFDPAAVVTARRGYRSASVTSPRETISSAYEMTSPAFDVTSSSESPAWSAGRQNSHSEPRYDGDTSQGVWYRKCHNGSLDTSDQYPGYSSSSPVSPPVKLARRDGRALAERCSNIENVLAARQGSVCVGEPRGLEGQVGRSSESRDNEELFDVKDESVWRPW